MGRKPLLISVTVITCANVANSDEKYYKWKMRVTRKQLDEWLAEGDKLDNYDCEVVEQHVHVPSARNKRFNRVRQPTLRLESAPLRVEQVPGLGLVVSPQYDD